MYEHLFVGYYKFSIIQKPIYGVFHAHLQCTTVFNENEQFAFFAGNCWKSFNSSYMHNQRVDM